MPAKILVFVILGLIKFNIASAQVDFDRCLLLEYEAGQYAIPLCFEDAYAKKGDGSGIYLSGPSSDHLGRPTIIPGECLRTRKTTSGVINGKQITRFYFKQGVIETTFTGVKAKGQRSGEIVFRNSDDVDRVKFIEMSFRDSAKLRAAFKRFYRYDLKLMCQNSYD